MKEKLNIESEKIQETLREIRGFLVVDRVALYQFLADGSGEVIAEELNQNHTLPSLLRLRFPASDIPQSARQKFLEEQTRVLVDVQLGRQLHQLPYGRGKVTYTAPSPCHLKYLEQLKIKSSLTIPLIVRQKLWGLLLVHHSQNQRWQESQLALLELLSERLPLLITTEQLLREQNALVYQETVLEAIRDLIPTGTNELPIPEILETIVYYFKGCGGGIDWEGLSAKIKNDQGRKCRETGDRESRERCLLPQSKICLQDGEDGILVYEVAFGDRPVCSALTIPLPSAEQGYMTIFRQLRSQTIYWAGRPPQTPEEKRQLRNSFNLWEEQKQLSAIESWTQEEIRLAKAIAQLLTDNFRQQALNMGVNFQEHYDPITQLPNRFLLMEHLNLLSHESARSDELFAVIFLDLDRFQQVNNTLGHIAGDQLLRLVAKSLAEQLQEQPSFLAHWHGDKFIIILRDLSELDSASLEQRISAIRQVFQTPFSLLDHQVYVKASWGIAISPYDGTDGETLLLNAETAMYSAKEQGRNEYQIYSPSLRSAINPLTLETEIRHSLENGNFCLYYQPQINLQTGKITGVEALIRWQHPTQGLLSPGQFIPFAEESDLICELGEWVLKEACQQLAQWNEQGIHQLRMAVNVSARCFQKADFVEKVQQILELSGIAPSNLEVEITETAVAQNTDLTRWILEQLQQMGIHVALDDFGMGYSSLNAIKQFPLTTVKIDRTFIKDIETSSRDRAIVDSVLILAQGLNLRVVAEGIETLGQLAHLQTFSCSNQEIQGYLVSEPLQSEAALSFLKNNSHQKNLTFFHSQKPSNEKAQANSETPVLQKQVFKQAFREQLVAQIAQQVHSSLDLEEIFQVTVEKIRDFLDTDRVILYQFDSQWKGKVVIESVGEDWQPLFNQTIEDPCFEKKSSLLYAQGKVAAIEDIETMNLDRCYQEMLQSFQVRANLVIPILNHNRLWGLLIAHHCRGPRHWEQSEITLLQQLVTQVGVAINQAELYQQLQQANQKLQALVVKDDLTQIANRRCFDQVLDHQWQHLQREKQPLALILCDVDQFKPYNDHYGHQAGDRCLQQVAIALQGAVHRPDDLVARYGGEEFAMILPNTSAEKAMVVAERARNAIAALQIPHQQSSVSSHVTISLGVSAIIPAPDQIRKTLVQQADQALYAAKAGGRDRAVKYSCQN